jgi:hypothetical protein
LGSGPPDEQAPRIATARTAASAAKVGGERVGGVDVGVRTTWIPMPVGPAHASWPILGEESGLG